LQSGGEKQLATAFSFLGSVKESKYHPREWVDVYGPAYTERTATFSLLFFLPFLEMR